MSSIEERNYEAVAQTLVHHGKIQVGLDEEIKGLQAQIAALRLELEQQRGLIVRSLQQTYGHGSTSGE